MPLCPMRMILSPIATTASSLGQYWLNSLSSSFFSNQQNSPDFMRKKSLTDDEKLCLKLQSFLPSKLSPLNGVWFCLFLSCGQQCVCVCVCSCIPSVALLTCVVLQLLQVLQFPVLQVSIFVLLSGSAFFPFAHSPTTKHWRLKC